MADALPEPDPLAAQSGQRDDRARAMRTQPRGQSYGRYPHNCSFGPFRVSYADDLSEIALARAPGSARAAYINHCPGARAHTDLASD